MMRIDIQLHTFEEIKNFVNLMNKVEGSVDLCRNNYRVDAKSFMGVLTLQRTQATLEIQEENPAELLDEISKFMPCRASA